SRPRTSDRNAAFRDPYGISADSHVVKLTALHLEGQRDDAGATHLEPLLYDALVVTVGQIVEMLDHAGERHGRGARRRVFQDAKIRREHAGVEVGGGVDRLAAVEEG